MASTGALSCGWRSCRGGETARAGAPAGERAGSQSRPGNHSGRPAERDILRSGLENIPRLHGDLMPRALFYENCVNEGVTSHFNAISSILTGVWQHVDDWGRDLPRNPTLINYLRSQLRWDATQTFVVTSNKALTANIGAGGNVILAKQLLIEAVERIVMGMSNRPRLERELLLEELTQVMQQDYERIGWEVPGPAATMDPKLKQMFLTALADFMKGPDNASSGDELTL